jgi:hypothetical protein
MAALASGQQNPAVARMNAGLSAETQRLTAARSEAIRVSLAQPRGDAEIQARAGEVRAAELDLATKRADLFAALQASPNPLSAEQVRTLTGTFSAPARRGRGVYPASMPHATAQQTGALTEMTSAMSAQAAALARARTDVVAASLKTPRDDGAIRAAVDAVASAELAMAKARADALARVQGSAERLDAEQIQWLASVGGSYGTVGFTEPEPMNFQDHRGYISLFDGVSLKDWDGNPKFWRVEGGAIVGESTPENPSGNSYIVYRGVEAKDFTLKFEIKVEGPGGSGLQYRSHTGIPWNRPIPANVTANVGPVNLNWMMTGPQADFWPSQIYSGQFYSENTPLGIMAFRGQVVDGAGLGAKRLMGTIGDRTVLGNLVKMNDWNEYTVIARGGTFIHIVNGQLMAVMVDDDPQSNNNQSGLFGIEIEATTKVSVRNIWLKKLN